MTMPSEQTMRTAIADRDAAYDGRFVYAVITTGVFCRPSCPSRPAKAENLRFFANTESALAAGFRPCQRCQFAEAKGELKVLVELARYIEAHAEQRLPLQVLSTRTPWSASRLQRLFRQAFGLSPKLYQDAVRMRRFKQSLQQGESVTEAIYTAGYGSSSRVYGEASRNVGMTPKAYRSGGAGETIYYAFGETVLGWVAMAATEIGVCFVQFADDREDLLGMLSHEFPKAQLCASPAQSAPELSTWIAALDAYIRGNGPKPDLPLDIRGTAFQMQVWRFLLGLNEGEVLSYTELAQSIGKPKAVRAAASACAANRIGVLIPCHRVLRGDGGLGGYRWGLQRKRTLLDSERTRREP